LALLRQFNREVFHAAGQRYRDASHGRCVVVPSRVHFGPTGDDIDRSGRKQSGNYDHGEYVTHGNPSLFILGIMPIKPKFSVTAVTKFLFFVDSTPYGY
jgi:hypothetical protein